MKLSAHNIPQHYYVYIVTTIDFAFVFSLFFSMCESDYIAHVITLYIEINSKHRTLSSDFNSVTWRLSLVFNAFDSKKSTKNRPRFNCAQTKPFLHSRSNQYLHCNLWTHYFPLAEDSHLLASRFNLQYLRNIAKIGSIWLYDLNKPLCFLWHKDVILRPFCSIWQQRGNQYYSDLWENIFVVSRHITVNQSDIRISNMYW